MQIVFSPTGEIEFTRNPQLLEVINFGHKRVERMTDILFHVDLQRYYVKFLQGPFARSALSVDIENYYPFSHDYGGFEDEFQVHTEYYGLITFSTYEAAVRAEVRFVEFLRDIGYSMR